MSAPKTERFKLSDLFRKFYAISRSGGGILLLCTLVSLALANSAFSDGWLNFWHTHVGIQNPNFHLYHSLTDWINDGLMTLFFLLVGLEIERELIVGELSDRRQAAMPIIAAIGGMLAPALLYTLVNLQSSATILGVGIPTATDIAFALAVIGLLGNRVPPALKVFLVALAIMDDLGAIVVIAVFYGQGVTWAYLLGALGVFGLLMIFKRMRVLSLWIYLPLGLVLWFLMLHSGIHATLAGVLLAFAIPFHSGVKKSPSHTLEQGLQMPVNYIVIPLFALANTALHIAPGAFENLAGPVGLGIFAGLVLGKPLGIYLASILAIKFKIGTMPEGSNGKMLLGAGMLGGIGFTMAIFVSNLAFTDPKLIDIAKLAILLSSAVAAVLGLVFLRLMSTKNMKE